MSLRMLCAVVMFVNIKAVGIATRKAFFFGRFRLPVFYINYDESKKLKNSSVIIQYPLLFCSV